MAHLHPTAELSERAILPDDPGQALALTRVLFTATPRMFNHHRGLWGYSGMAIDGAPLTVQSTGIGGPSAAIVVGELHALGLTRAVRIGRAWPLGPALGPDALVAATELVAGDAIGRALGAETSRLDAAMTDALAAVADVAGAIASGDGLDPDPAWSAAGVLAHDLETAAVVGAAARAGIRIAAVVALDAPQPIDDPVHDRIAERLGRAALAALAP